MKKIALLSIIFALAQLTSAQNVGIGTNTPDASAQVDISSVNKGLLLPRMTTSAINAISNPAKGLLVYDTVKNQLMVNMGSSMAANWQTIVAKSGWSLNGNSGNNPTTDFIGTTDSIPFVIKAFNQKAGRIESAYGSTFFGYKAGNSNISSPYYTSNTAIGSLAFQSNINGSQNVAIGNEALSNNISGSSNVANGYYALLLNISGDRNTGIGYQALLSNTAGNNNVAVGDRALVNNQTGNGNVAIGSKALWRNFDRSNLVAIGDSALYWNGQALEFWEAIANTAVGSKALFGNLSGSYLTATGNRSLYSNTSGSENTAYGSFSMEDNTTGDSNSALGYGSLGNNTNGSQNTAVGMWSLLGSTTGSFNTACGMSALLLNQTGSNNTGIGYQALYFNRNSQFNTAVGYRAGKIYDLGWNNTIIGADADVSFNGQYNTIVIGNLATATDNGKVRIGNSANWSYEAFANWTNISDGRFKKNITDDVAGINFIMKLRPVNYQMDITALSEKFNERKGIENNLYSKASIAEKENMIWTGFVAQEVEAAANEIGFHFSGVDKPRNEHGVYGLRYAEFVVPLVKAVQEQQQIIDTQTKKIENQQRDIDSLKQQMAELLQLVKK
jgi:trimeric autotransporter adhesin